MPKAPKTKKPAAVKKEKKAKDPHAPKKPMGAYMFFCKDMRAQVKEDNPGFSVTDVGRRLGEMWKELGDGAKQPYHRQAEEDKERYAQEQAAYTKKKGAGEGDGEEADEE